MVDPRNGCRVQNRVGYLVVDAPAQSFHGRRARRTTATPHVVVRLRFGGTYAAVWQVDHCVAAPGIFGPFRSAHNCIVNDLAVDQYLDLETIFDGDRASRVAVVIRGAFRHVSRDRVRDDLTAVVSDDLGVGALRAFVRTQPLHSYHGCACGPAGQPFHAPDLLPE